MLGCPVVQREKRCADHPESTDGNHDAKRDGNDERHALRLRGSTDAIGVSDATRLNYREAVTTGGLDVSDNTSSTPGVPADGPREAQISQPQTRRERRLLEAAKAQIAAQDAQVAARVSAAPVPAVVRAARIPPAEPNSAAADSLDSSEGNVALTPIESEVTSRRSRREKNSAGARSPRPPRVAEKPRREPRRSRKSAPDAHKGKWSSSLRGAVVLVVGAFMATVALPSTGFNLAAPGFAAQTEDVLQVVTASDATDTATAITRDGYKVSSYGDLYGFRFGSLSYAYTVLNSGPIRWPFPAAVPISSGYGHRQAPCAACSSDHRGLDFNPGEGSPIYSIAAGVVVESHNDRWGFGRWIVLRHNVNGLQFDSIYAHMQRDSVSLKVGDTVEVAEYVGRVGSTGTSTGAHLHLEIIVNGVQVDPFTWLKANAAK